MVIWFLSKDKSSVGVINARKHSYQLLPRIRNFSRILTSVTAVNYLFQTDILVQISFQFHLHFSSKHDKEASRQADNKAALFSFTVTQILYHVTILWSLM